LEPEDFLEEEDLEEPDLEEDFLTFDLYPEEDEDLDLEPESDPERYLLSGLSPEYERLLGYFLIL
jgi:hypothetical protein